MSYTDKDTRDALIGDKVTSVTLAVTLGMLLAALALAIITGLREGDATRGAIVGGVVMMFAMGVGATGLIVSMTLPRRGRDPSVGDAVAQRGDVGIVD